MTFLGRALMGRSGSVAFWLHCCGSVQSVDSYYWYCWGMSGKKCFSSGKWNVLDVLIIRVELESMECLYWLASSS
jgi:hypothetical protein